MHFTEVRLINFGLYSGEHVIDLRPAEGMDERAQPIILIGGKNGAGKTTILEAVRLCLYGPESLGRGTRRTAYESYLRGRIHRQIGAPLGHTFAGVGVGFIHTIAGSSHSFSVRRMWERRRSGLSESVEIKRDGAPLRGAELDWWGQFLHDLLPPGLADLFFFDGEKIQALADDPDDSALGAAIRSLLGLDVLDRLQGDLAVYLARQRRGGEAGLDRQLSDLRARSEANEAEFAQAHTALAHTRSQMARVQAQAGAAERLLASEGGGVAAQRDSLKQRSEALQEQLRRHERALAEHAGGLLPFAIIAPLAAQLKARLELDERAEHYIQVSTSADYFVEEFQKRLMMQESWSAGAHLSRGQRDKLIDNLGQMAHAIHASLLDDGDAELRGETVIHPLEREARRELLGWLSQASDGLPQQIAALGDAIESDSAELAAVAALLARLPADEHVQPILQQLATLQRELGALEHQHAIQENALKLLRQQRDALAREEHALSTRLMRGDDPSQRVRLASRAQQALLRFEVAMRRSKLGELEQAIGDCFGHLSRKGRYIRRVHIDPDTFATTLYNIKGDALPREQLSAGEKQIYAVALLWALRLVSGRALPIIVDTPLGRLDSEHRRRLVQRYFPSASHQVILLSTDTEIDERLYSELRPAIARTYQLGYRADEASSQVTSGYFWDDAPAAPAAELTPL